LDFPHEEGQRIVTVVEIQLGESPITAPRGSIMADAKKSAK
jgi:hypothetical protein